MLCECLSTLLKRIRLTQKQEQKQEFLINECDVFFLFFLFLFFFFSSVSRRHIL
jgi:hypothetical protein